MTKILSIDPSSNVIDTSTTGIILLDNTSVEYAASISYGVDNFNDWWETIGSTLQFDICVVEKYIARDSGYSRDNSVLETIAAIQEQIPTAYLQQNSGYTTDVPDKLLRKLKLWNFNDKTHHQDIRAAARLALFHAMRTDIEDVVTDIGLKLKERL